jgi:glycosyltransferase involved in cell wall biosynthesis
MMNPVLLCGSEPNGAVEWYRLEQPARWLTAHGHPVRTAYGEINIERRISAISLQRTGGDLVPKILLLRAQGVRTIYELDDDIWSLPSWNPWRLSCSDEIKRAMEAIMCACDVATVTTERLAKLVGQKTRKPVYVVPNAIPLDLVPPPGERTLPGVRVGWWGSNTHQGDLVHVLPAMRKLLRDRTDVTLVFMGAPLPQGMSAGPRIEWHKGVSMREFYGALRELQLDVMVAPLEDHHFNWAKSNVKVLEAGAMGCAIVASDVGPYRCIRDGETGFKVKANAPSRWVSLLMEVVDDERLRARVGAGARAWVEKECSMDVTGPLWAEAVGVPSCHRAGR